MSYKFAILLLAFVLCNPLYAWENKKTHPAITDSSIATSTVDNYFKTQIGFANGITTQLYWNFPQDVKTRIDRGDANPNQTTRDISEWLRVGSIIEDEDGRRIAPWRPRHHFYDPTRNAGLDNHTDHPEWEAPFWSSWLPLGESALTWATIGQASYDPRNNHDKWGTARTIFYQALTEEDSNTRQARLAESLMKLGCVLHLLEDMGVPAHTRNDFLFGHYRSAYMFDWGNPFEGWVEEQIEQNGGQCPWSGSGPVVFNKLANYFDAEMYSGDYLGNGGLPPETWGLSECSNYQFLSLSTIFRDDGSLYVFPHPAKEHVEPDIIVPVADGNKIYFNGSNYGVSHIARESYTYYRATIWDYTYPVIDSTNTTDDDVVFQDYASVTIPRTIDYTTGLVNYFFRGRLSIEPNWADPNIVELTITNDSNNSGVPQVLKGGIFKLYWDDRDGNRAEVPVYTVFESNMPGETTEWNEESILEYGQTIRAEFNQPAAEGITAYTLVYKGSISQNPSEPDLDDPNAVAVAVFRPGYSIIAWGRDDYGQVSDVPDGNEFTAVAAGKRHCLALKYDGSLLGWGYNNHGECNVPPGNDYTDISAGVWHSIALKSDGSIIVWGDDGLNQITDKPDGNDFIAIAAGDYHSLVLKSDGIIVGWGGWNTYGECDAPDPDPGTVFTDIAAGKYHSLGLQSDGKVKAWGSNNQGQTRIYDGAANKVHVAVAASDNYSFLLRDDDMLISWGGGDWIEPGIPRYHYRQPDSNDFVAIAAGTDHIVALTSDCKAFEWDWPVGDFPFDSFARPVPPDVVFIEDIDAGYDFSLALKVP